MNAGLLRATATLVAGSVAAHALPLILGPALTRVYSPDDFGQFALLWAVSANLAVVGCARYEFALPLEREDPRAAQVMALCAHVLATVTAASAAVGLVLVLWGDWGLAWTLPLAVLATAAVQWLMLWATRAQRFGLLSAARFMQQGGGATLQLILGLAVGGPLGLVLGATVASAGAAWMLARPAPLGGWSALRLQPWARLRAVAHHHRNFPLLNTPHAFLGALQDTLTLVLVTAWTGDAAAGFWALALRYLKAPATLIGGALSQALYPQLVAVQTRAEGRALVRKAVAGLLAIACPVAALLMLWGPDLFVVVFGIEWSTAGHLARAMAIYIGLHFVASPLAVVTMAWNAQAWALRVSIAGQCLFFLGLLAGLHWGGLPGAGWGISATMLLYFTYYLWSLANWKDAR